MKTTRLLSILILAVLSGSSARGSRQFQSITDTLIGPSTALPSSGTVNFQVNPQFTLGDGNFHIFFEVADASASKFFQVIGGPANRIYSAWSNGTSNQAATANSVSLPANTWNTITVTWIAGGAMTLYLNGSQIATTGNTPWFDTTGLPWSFGNRASSGYDVRAKFSAFGIWSRVLTPSEITLLSFGNSASAIPSGLFAEYDLAGSSLAPQTGGTVALAAAGPVASSDPTVVPAVLTLSGPPAGTTGSSSSWLSPWFVVTASNASNTTVVTPNDGAGGAFVPTTVALTNSVPVAIFRYLPASQGNKTISITNGSGVTNPAAVTYSAVSLPALSSDVTSQTVAHGTDATYNLTLSAGSTPPRLILAFVPAGSTFSVPSTTCSATSVVQSIAAWSDCGAAASGLYPLTIHTAGLAPGTYYFNVFTSVPQAVNGSGVTLTITIT